MHKNLAIVVVTAFAAVCALAQHAPQVQAQVDNLTALRQELEAKQAALAGLDVAERSLIEGLGSLDESVARLDDERAANEVLLTSLQAEVATIERTMGLDEDELARLRARLDARLRTMLADGEGGTARALLGAEGFTELALRRRYLQTLAKSDARLVTDVRRVEASVLEQRRALKARIAQVTTTTTLLKDQQALLTATREERGRTLERVRNERGVLKAAALELTSKHRELQLLVAKLAEGPRYKPPTGKSGVLKQGLAVPVSDGVVIRNFGSVVDNDKAEIVSNGIELRAAPGLPVVAVADGRIVHTGWLRGFGRIVLVDHGEGHHTLSAHLARAAVGVGDEVKRGETIGFVGDTESLNGPKLYFELRENGRPRDPTPFFRP
ncbi:MAG TPA: peptidoglycan DD-metalloendopeptidase family protein [Myxococcota bacterium]